MNHANITKLITTLESPPDERFKMSGCGADLLHDCGTAGCIGAWAQALALNEGHDYTVGVASSWLELKVHQAEGLFLAPWLEPRRSKAHSHPSHPHSHLPTRHGPC